MTTMNAINSKKEKGFTLIELVMVIVILGILAAFALPRFADLGGDARRATLEGAEGSVKSAAAITHSKWLAQGSTGDVTVEGSVTVTMSPEGYPTSDAAGIGAASQLDATDYTLTAGTDEDADPATVSPAGATTPATCIFSYDPTTGQTSGFDAAGC